MANKLKIKGYSNDKEKNGIMELILFWELGSKIKHQSGKDWSQILKTFDNWSHLFYKKNKDI